MSLITMHEKLVLFKSFCVSRKRLRICHINLISLNSNKTLITYKGKLKSSLPTQEAVPKISDN